ncbi:hypothetical protein RRG08_030108 [Elysia crispata]|uniref:Uncharacterized protein n=1 Tax=Elysia crispata TaxID=231223 RepID=A0AAE0ZS95_9GAST|nr:hypothetical protein RRG08_030108 [Elysia crispata]
MTSTNIAATQFLSTPAKLPKEWQPKLHEWKTYHCSHPDVARVGWRKWSAEHPDWYAWRSTSRHPDWFNRETNQIRRADYKNVNWHFERPSKPTSRIHDDFIPFNNEVMMKDVQRPMPHNRGYRGNWSYPTPFPQEIPSPKWGLYNPPHYQEPTRLNYFPPIRYDGHQQRMQ